MQFPGKEELFDSVMTVSYTKLKKAAFFCLALPACVFMLGFVRWYIGIPVTLLIAAAYFFTVRDTRRDTDRVISLPVSYIVILGAVVVLWCYLSGLGNLYYQSSDWSARNAIFRDLITHKWPVVYEAKDAALVYYIGYWLPAAVIGKAIFLTTGNLDIAWYSGNACLWMWSAICIFITILMVMILVGASNKKRFWIALTVFIFFSGLDIIGTLINNWVWGIGIPNHIEWWTKFQFSSMATCLGWVFNQAVPSWIATACFLGEKNTRNYAFLAVFCAVSAPLPAIGLALYMIGYAVYLLINAIKEKQIKQFVYDVATPQNIIPAIAVFPIFLLYYKTNLAVNVGQDGNTSFSPSYGTIIILAAVSVIFYALMIIRKKRSESYAEYAFVGTVALLIGAFAFINTTIKLNYLAFIFLECMIYLFIIMSDNRKNPLFYLSFIVMALCPVIHVGTDADFCMRASIPLVFILMTMCLRYLFENRKNLSSFVNPAKTISCWLLIVSLLIGSVTACKEFKRGFDAVKDNKKLNVVNDSTYTFERIFTGSAEGTDRNFIATNYEETAFFKYIAKK